MAMVQVGKPRVVGTYFLLVDKFVARRQMNMHAEKRTG
jgi:hypothetical protein